MDYIIYVWLVVMISVVSTVWMSYILKDKKINLFELMGRIPWLLTGVLLLLLLAGGWSYARVPQIKRCIKRNRKDVIVFGLMMWVG
ncbi:hypothetical protein [Ammoniphilus sp. CFH 90114]|uniref:hypothetical protein n=1 Tax=Ammoniphilus sp. CFH 90114 TaxID=2493665 RepID=UPI00100F9C36|nr:hypothetical protein [Ammoniphilus sp. CFH 90114]RXT03827.1 hypothetical protein EIZ39_22890 [Ammoniphilus sp. CFH 90114]